MRGMQKQGAAQIICTGIRTSSWCSMVVSDAMSRGSSSRRPRPAPASSLRVWGGAMAGARPPICWAAGFGGSTNCDDRATPPPIGLIFFDFRQVPAAAPKRQRRVHRIRALTPDTDAGGVTRSLCSVWAWTGIGLATRDRPPGASQQCPYIKDGSGRAHGEPARAPAATRGDHRDKSGRAHGEQPRARPPPPPRDGCTGPRRRAHGRGRCHHGSPGPAGQVAGRAGALQLPAGQPGGGPAAHDVHGIPCAGSRQAAPLRQGRLRHLLPERRPGAPVRPAARRWAAGACRCPPGSLARARHWAGPPHPWRARSPGGSC
jgi:hypothetical protein